ncbi:MAG: structural protein [Cellvibrionaceae bacterium]|nr:structural protein [Cellvibrionaceae bacterium]
MTLTTQRPLPRGIRNNNPGNIRRTADQWQGMSAVQNDSAFVQFDSPEYGFRAMARILRNYDKRGLNTVREIISTYAPATENKTEAYIRFVVERLNTLPDAALDIEAVMPELIHAITVFENGLAYADYYSSNTIQQGVALA